jgi:molecular chaperone GrpE
MGEIIKMSKNETSKKTTWEKIKAEADAKTAEKESVNQEAPTQKSESTAQLPHTSYQALEEQLSKTEAQLEEHKSKLIQYKEQEAYRLAEMENIRRRSKLDIENAYKFSLEKLIKELLPIKDSLEAALAPNINTANDPKLTGVQLTLHALQKALEKNGIKAIEPKAGDSFDAHYHQAMLTEASAEYPPHAILKVLQKGYLLYDRLLRPALVVVSKAVEENTESAR